MQQTPIPVQTLAYSGAHSDSWRPIVAVLAWISIVMAVMIIVDGVDYAWPDSGSGGGKLGVDWKETGTTVLYIIRAAIAIALIAGAIGCLCFLQIGRKAFLWSTGSLVLITLPFVIFRMLNASDEGDHGRGLVVLLAYDVKDALLPALLWFLMTRPQSKALFSL